MNWYQVALWTMIFLKSGAFLVFVWWWMFKRATKPYVRPQDVVVDETPYDDSLTMEEVMKNHGIVRTEKPPDRQLCFCYKPGLWRSGFYSCRYLRCIPFPILFYPYGDLFK